MKIPVLGDCIVWSALALSAASTISAAAIKREPHFPEIVKPASGYILHSQGKATGTFDFRYLDGGQGEDNLTVKVSLVNNKGDAKVVAKAIPFNEYVAESNIAIAFKDFPNGNYTLLAQELVHDSTGYTPSATNVLLIQD